jgi:hypothetical protein
MSGCFMTASLLIASCSSKPSPPQCCKVGYEWAGGADGGVWIRYRWLDSNVVHAVVYWENGEFADSGDFEVADKGAKVGMAGYDGDILILRDGRPARKAQGKSK